LPRRGGKPNALTVADKRVCRDITVQRELTQIAASIRSSQSICGAWKNVSITANGHYLGTNTRITETIVVQPGETATNNLHV
jgi:hypothetical protein